MLIIECHNIAHTFMCQDIVTGRLGRACETQQNQVQVRLLCGSTQLFVGFRFTLPNLLWKSDPHSSGLARLVLGPFGLAIAVVFRLIARDLAGFAAGPSTCKP
jgi:hypothetical protein